MGSTARPVATDIRTGFLREYVFPCLEVSWNSRLTLLVKLKKGNQYHEPGSRPENSLGGFHTVRRPQCFVEKFDPAMICEIQLLTAPDAGNSVKIGCHPTFIFCQQVGNELGG